MMIKIGGMLTLQLADDDPAQIFAMIHCLSCNSLAHDPPPNSFKKSPGSPILMIASVLCGILYTTAK